MIIMLKHERVVVDGGEAIRAGALLDAYPDAAAIALVEAGEAKLYEPEPDEMYRVQIVTIDFPAEEAEDLDADEDAQDADTEAQDDEE